MRTPVSISHSAFPPSHDAGEALGAAIHERHAPTPVERAELRADRGDPEAAPSRQLEPAREAIAVDRGDGRLPRIEAGEAQGPRPLDERVPEELVDVLQIEPRAERPAASAGDYQDAGGIIRRERLDRPGRAVSPSPRRHSCGLPGG
jgi:hypothetical protein